MVKHVVVTDDPELCITYDPNTNLDVLIQDRFSDEIGLVVIGDVEELDKLIKVLQQASKEMKARVSTRKS